MVRQSPPSRPGRPVAALAAAVLSAAMLALGGCVTKSDITGVQDDIAQLRVENARRDSARAAQLSDVIRGQQRVLDSLGTSGRATGALRGDLQTDLYNIQQQLVQLQELTGQSQQRLTELRTQLEARNAQMNAAPPAPTAAESSGADSTAPSGGSSTAGPTGVAPTGGAPTGGTPGAGASADQMYEASLAQLRRGSTSTARQGLSELVRSYPASERVPDALYFIGQSYAAEKPDSAAVYYNQVVDRYAQSSRAPAALYNLGLLAERRKNSSKAKDAYQRVVKQFPRSDEASLARDRLKALGR
ncbi:MAG: tetratricopeptide repeat protein [Gemmatimonadales bacterium]|nr:tetratricopeptide repeat protein [Gemmatimonadales bacterium]